MVTHHCQICSNCWYFELITYLTLKTCFLSCQILMKPNETHQEFFWKANKLNTVMVRKLQPSIYYVGSPSVLSNMRLQWFPCACNDFLAMRLLGFPVQTWDRNIEKYNESVKIIQKKVVKSTGINVYSELKIAVLRHCLAGINRPASAM